MKQDIFLSCAYAILFSWVTAINVDLLPDCGKSKAGRIIGGTDAKAGAWPWMAAISVNGRFICGGSIITKQIIMTSASCVVNDAIVTDYRVRVGSLNYNEGGQVYVVDKIVKHPSFNSSGQLKNDIALFRLATPISKFNTSIFAICFPEVELAGPVATVIGWGKDENGQYSTKLKQANVTIVGLPECNTAYENVTQVIPITNTQICAGGKGTDINIGDYGGPLMKSITTADGITQWHAVGLASFGLNNNATPSVYTNLGMYFFWIGDEIENLYEPALPPDCGKNNVQARILGGTDAKSGNWPWMASISINNFHVCGGSIITQDIILTSARCYNKYKDIVTNFKVRVGSLKINEDGQVYTVSKVKIHPKFNSSNMENDLALFKLALPITEFNDTVGNICLFSVLPSNAKGVIIGWGLTGKGTFSHTLRQATVPLVGLDECNKAYELEHRAITDNQLCAGGVLYGNNTCPGDYGGPLMMGITDASGTSQWIVAGISSFGSRLWCSSVKPGVYTNVPKYWAWIRKAMDELNQA